jgi:Protein of unknown function (DUF4054)
MRYTCQIFCGEKVQCNPRPSLPGVDNITFKARFPEFARLPDATLNDVIARATKRTNPTVLGEETDEAIGYMAAHLLALSPYGQQARLSEPGKMTTYYQHWLEIARYKSVGYARVTGIAGGPWF